MRSTRFIPIAVLVLAAACSETSSDPASNNSPANDPPSLGSVHFIRNATSCTRSGDNLVCNFKEAGIEQGATVTVTLNATGTATYVCLNNGGQVPSDQKKTTITTQISVSGEFTADKNGNITGQLILSPPGPGGFSCPNGQTVTGPSNVSYTLVSIVDSDNTKTFNVSGTF